MRASHTLAAALICAVLLTGCAQRTASPDPIPDLEQLPPPYSLTVSDAAPAENEQARMQAEHPVYGPGVTKLYFLLENRSGEELYYGEEYALETWRKDAWQVIPLRPDTGFNEMARIFPDGETQCVAVNTALFDYAFSEGRYRLVKDVGGVRTAEFSIGPSQITPATPFGFGPLEALPDDYDAQQAASDGVLVVLPDGSLSDASLLTGFLEKADAGMPAMLRTLRHTVEGDAILTDVIYDQYGRQAWTCRTDSTRDRFEAQRGISEQIFAYLITDGQGLYLSDCADHALLADYPDARCIPLLPPESCPPEAAQTVRARAQRLLQANIARCKVYSPGAAMSGACTCGLDFLYEAAGYGSTATLPKGPAVRLDGIWWLDGAQLLLRAQTGGTQDYFAVFDVAQEKITQQTLADAVSISTDGTPVFENTQPVSP